MLARLPHAVQDVLRVSADRSAKHTWALSANSELSPFPASRNGSSSMWAMGWNASQGPACSTMSWGERGHKLLTLNRDAMRAMLDLDSASGRV